MKTKIASALIQGNKNQECHGINKTLVDEIITNITTFPPIPATYYVGL